MTLCKEFIAEELLKNDILVTLNETSRKHELIESDQAYEVRGILEDDFHDVAMLIADLLTDKYYLHIEIKALPKTK